MASTFLSRKGGFVMNFILVIVSIVLWIIALEKDVYIKHDNFPIYNLLQDQEPSIVLNFKSNLLNQMNNVITLTINDINRKITASNTGNTINQSLYNLNMNDIDELFSRLLLNYEFGFNRMCLLVKPNSIDIKMITKVNSLRNEFVKRVEKLGTTYLNEYDKQVLNINDQIRKNINDTANKFVRIDLFIGECLTYDESSQRINTVNYPNLGKYKDMLKKIANIADKAHNGAMISFYIIMSVLFIVFILLLTLTKATGVIALFIYRILLILLFIASAIIFFGISRATSDLHDQDELYKNKFLKTKYWGISLKLILSALVIITLVLIHSIFINVSGMTSIRENILPF